MAEMKQWVREERLNWDMWWQYCLHARHQAADSGSRSPTNMKNPMGKPRAVPLQMKSHQKVRPQPQPQVISKAQSQALANLAMASIREQGERRPQSDEEWYQLAIEALEW